MSRSLILGFCSDYAFEIVEPFLASWRAGWPDAELCLFQTRLDRRFHAAARRLNIICEDPRPFITADVHPQTSRFRMYRHFLNENPSRWDHILITDVRDVIFQSDPFAQSLPAEVVFAAEQMTIGGCPYNSGWIQGIFGSETLKEMAAHVISCSGTTFGTTAGILKYLDAMNQLLGSVTFDKAWAGSDQGIHNYLLRQMKPNWSILDEADRFVATVGYTQVGEITVDDRGIMVFGKFAPVVHQWDRHEMLREYVKVDSRFHLYPPQARKSAALLTRTLSAGWSRLAGQFPGTRSRGKVSAAMSRPQTSDSDFRTRSRDPLQS